MSLHLVDIVHFLLLAILYTLLLAVVTNISLYLIFFVNPLRTVITLFYIYFHRKINDIFKLIKYTNKIKEKLNIFFFIKILNLFTIFIFKN